jgi:hypothetical protein
MDWSRFDQHIKKYAKSGSDKDFGQLCSSCQEFKSADMIVADTVAPNALQRCVVRIVDGMAFQRF